MIRFRQSAVASFAAALIALATGCAGGAGHGSGQPDDAKRPAPGEFSVMTYNVRRYGLTDRDGDGQENDPKPEAEISSLIDVIVSERPDVLAVQEMGPQPFFADFRARLEARGLVYPHDDLLIAPVRGDANLAVLSRFPITSNDGITNSFYSIGTNRVPVLRGIQSLEIRPAEDYAFRLINVHLKSRLFSSLGQTEMRRNEARLLNKAVRKELARNPEANLVVVGDFNDTIQSAALREAKGDELVDLRARDVVGDEWTHAWDWEDTYTRFDYILVSDAMVPEVVRSKVFAVRHPRMLDASDHRPVVAVFTARDKQRPTSPPRAQPSGDSSGARPPARDP